MKDIRLLPAGIFFLGILAVSVGFANAQCPAVGADTGCGTIITITDTGATFVPTGQGPYDSIEDTLVGVLNNSHLPVSSIDLASGVPVFGFDGDGIDTYGIPGNAKDSTGYGGPNAYFTNFGGLTSGTVNFITPIAAGGGTSFFSLEGAISGATACSDLLNNSVPKPAGGGTDITTTFTPQGGGYTLSEAAQLCGFIEFDWQSTITSLPAPSPFKSACSPAALVAPPRFNDPPACGYAYQNPPNAVQLPVYWNLFTSGPLSLTANETATQLFFGDGPKDPCLPGPQSATLAAVADKLCGGKGVRAPAGSKLAFTTHLVGIAGLLPGANIVDTGIGFKWTSTFNGTSGNIAVLNGILPTDPGGTGNITVTSYNGTSTYNGIGVTGVNGSPPGTIPTLLSGSACNGVYSGTFDGDVTVVSGQSCMFVNGTITGNVHVGGGSLGLSGVRVGGNVQIDQDGTFSVGEFTTIDGNMEIHNLSSQQASDQVCNTTVYGNLEVHNNDVAVQIGSGVQQACPGNVVVGDLEVHDNSSSTSIYGNTVSGNLDDHNNTGSTQVFSNVVLKNLQCVNNASIIGGSNTANQKRGQCRGF
jgi:hypothetical protein